MRSSAGSLFLTATGIVLLMATSVAAHTYYSTSIAQPAVTFVSYTHGGRWYWDLNVTDIYNFNNASIIDLGRNPPIVLTQLVSLGNYTAFTGNGSFEGSFAPSDMAPTYAIANDDLKTLQGFMCMGYINLQVFTASGAVLARIAYDPKGGNKTCEEQAIRPPPPPAPLSPPPPPPAPLSPPPSPSSRPKTDCVSWKVVKSMKTKFTGATAVGSMPTTSFTACANACATDEACLSFNYRQNEPKSCTMFSKDRSILQRERSSAVTAGYLACSQWNT